jgi:hypothetical protein
MNKLNQRYGANEKGAITFLNDGPESYKERLHYRPANTRLDST